jgi:hypothetical protein
MRQVLFAPTHCLNFTDFGLGTNACPGGVLKVTDGTDGHAPAFILAVENPDEIHKLEAQTTNGTLLATPNHWICKYDYGADKQKIDWVKIKIYNPKLRNCEYHSLAHYRDGPNGCWFHTFASLKMSLSYEGLIEKGNAVVGLLDEKGGAEHLLAKCITTSSVFHGHLKAQLHSGQCHDSQQSKQFGSCHSQRNRFEIRLFIRQSQDWR